MKRQLDSLEFHGVSKLTFDRNKSEFCRIALRMMWDDFRPVFEPEHSSQAKDRDVMNSLGFSVHCVSWLSWLRWVMLSEAVHADHPPRITKRHILPWVQMHPNEWQFAKRYIGPGVLRRTRFPHTRTHRIQQEPLMLRGTSWILGPNFGVPTTVSQFKLLLRTMLKDLVDLALMVAELHQNAHSPSWTIQYTKAT